MVDITDIPDVRVGDEVVLIGKQGNETIFARELAKKAGTIDYEITTLLMARVPRFYKE
jgi:alanine racemase